MSTLAGWATRMAEPSALTAGPAAGGVAALAAALIEAACQRSAPSWARAPVAAEQARALQERALHLAAEDEVAYAHATDIIQERNQLAPALRAGLVDAALEHAEKILLIIMACACDVAQLADEAADHVDPDDQADVVAAVSLAETVAQICKHLIEETFPRATSDHHVAEVKRLLQIATAARQRTTTAAIQTPMERP